MGSDKSTLLKVLRKSEDTCYYVAADGNRTESDLECCRNPNECVTGHAVEGHYVEHTFDNDHDLRLILFGVAVGVLGMIIIILLYAALRWCKQKSAASAKGPTIISLKEPLQMESSNYDHTKTPKRSANLSPNFSSKKFPLSFARSPPQSTKNSNVSEPPSKESPLVVQNALAVIVCISEYDDEVEMGNSSAIEKDYENYRNFFEEELNYTVIPQRDQKADLKLKWTEKELRHLLMRDIKKEMIDQNGNLKYDALIVCISCHGMQGAVISSDLKKIQKDLLHRAVSHFDGKVRRIPRIFIIDACDGL